MTTRSVKPSEVAPGHLVERKAVRSGMPLGWFGVTEARWDPDRKRYYVRIAVPESMRNRVAPYFYVSPGTRVTVLTNPDETP